MPETRNLDTPRVLVVDDELNIAELVSMALRYAGFEVEMAGTGREALERAEEFRPQILVLDVMLPDFDGFEVARRLTAGGRAVPILFLTARDTTQDKVRGLTLGGDDYVTKPFSVEELIARVRAILRRAGVDGDASRLSFEDLELDDETREVQRAGTAIELTDTEYRLLRYLMLNPRRVLSRAQILDHVWQYDFGGDARVLETYISYLRKKVDTQGPRLIHTVRGVGYVLRRPRS
jgi:two-component system OmpR family response regulator